MPVKEKIGVVISNSMQKTVVIKVEDRYAHPIYSKTVIKTTKYLVHDEINECNIWDEILVQESRHLRRRKRWTLKKILAKSSLI